MENLNTALLLTLVGITTVFAVLALLIVFGKYLILFVNRFSPEEEAKIPAAGISADIEKVLAETVKTITGGRGTIGTIEKL